MDGYEYKYVVSYAVGGHDNSVYIRMVVHIYLHYLFNFKWRTFTMCSFSTVCKQRKGDENRASAKELYNMEVFPPFCDKLNEEVWDEHLLKTILAGFRDKMKKLWVYTI